MLRHLAKRILAPWFYLTANREQGMKMESDFWDRWMATQGLEWKDEFKARFDPEREIDGLHQELLAKLPDPAAAILDVGAGPVTAIGPRFHGRALDLTAVDPLADEYDRLLAKHRLTPPVRTQRCAGEDLASHFAGRTFAWVHAQNCLDHARDPIAAIRAMATVCAPGGLISLWHEEDEAVRESWRGLHQWNFHIRDGRLELTGRKGFKAFVDDATGLALSVERRGGHLLATAIR